MPPLVVETDRAAINRLYRRVVGMHTVILLGIVALMIFIGYLTRDSTLGPLAYVPFLVVLVGQTFQIGFYAYAWGARVALNQPLVVSTDGLVINTAAGTIAVPWEAVRSVRRISMRFNPVLRIDLHEAAGPGSPGVVTTASESYWTRLRKSGLRIGAKGLSVPLEQVQQAVGALSGGRVPVS